MIKKNLNLRLIALILTFSIYAVSTPWHNWKDYYYYQKFIIDVQSLKNNYPLMSDPLALLENRYQYHPRILCRLAEFYQSLQSNVRAKILLKTILKKNSNLRPEEMLDLFSTAEMIFLDKKEQLLFFNEFTDRYPDNKVLLIKKLFLLKDMDLLSELSFQEERSLEALFIETHNESLWEDVFAKKNIDAIQQD